MSRSFEFRCGESWEQPIELYIEDGLLVLEVDSCGSLSSTTALSQVDAAAFAEILDRFMLTGELGEPDSFKGLAMVHLRPVEEKLHT